MTNKYSNTVMMLIGLMGAGNISNAAEPSVYHAHDIQPYHAHDIQPYHAHDIQPYHAQGSQPSNSQPPVVEITKSNCKVLDPVLTSFYSGGCQNGLAEGNGTAGSEKGDTYSGYFHAGLENGHGRYHWAVGRDYEGDFVAGKLAGKGTLTESNGMKYIGEFTGSQKNGNGTLIWPNGMKYIGEFRSDSINGKGTLMLPNGYRYQGQFANNALNGSAVVTEPSGLRYQATFANNKLVTKGGIMPGACRNGAADYPACTPPTCSIEGNWIRKMGVARLQYTMHVTGNKFKMDGLVGSSEGTISGYKLSGTWTERAASTAGWSSFTGGGSAQVLYHNQSATNGIIGPSCKYIEIDGARYERP